MDFLSTPSMLPFQVPHLSRPALLLREGEHSGVYAQGMTARRRVLNVCMEQRMHDMAALSLPSLPCMLLTDSFLQIPGPNMYLYEELLMSSPSKGANA